MDVSEWEDFLKDHGNTVFNNWYNVHDFKTTNRIVQSIQNIPDNRVPKLVESFQTYSHMSNGTLLSVNNVLKMNGFFLDISEFSTLIITNRSPLWKNFGSYRSSYM